MDLNTMQNRVMSEVGENGKSSGENHEAKYVAKCPSLDPKSYFVVSQANTLHS